MDKTADQIFEIVKNYTVPKYSFAFYDATIATFRKHVENNPLEYSKKASELELSDAAIQYELLSRIGKCSANRQGHRMERSFALIEHNRFIRYLLTKPWL